MDDVCLVSTKGLITIRVANAMSEQTPYTITCDMVRRVKGNSSMIVYAAQVNDVTLLCRVDENDELSVKTVCW